VRAETAGKGGKGPRRLVVIEANTMLRIVCVSDTHGKHRKTMIPDGHILLHAGDLTEHGKLDEVEDFNRWLGSLPHRHNDVDGFTGNR